MQTLTKEEYLQIESQEAESSQSEDWKPPKEAIKKFVYSPYGDSENSGFSENNNDSISLEELEAEERKTQRPAHQRPLTKIFIVGVSIIPFFAFIYMFMGGTKKPAQIAKAIQQSSTKDNELVAQNQELQEEIDQMELELAKLRQEKTRLSSAKPIPQAEVEKVEKVKTPPPPKPTQQITPAKTVVARQTRPRQVPVARPPVQQKPTAEDLMRRRQLLAQSVVFGGSMGNTQESLTPVYESEYESEYEPEIASNSIAPNPNVTLVSGRNQPNRALLMANVNTPAVQQPIDFSIGSVNSRPTPVVQKQFTPGTSISAESLHPAFFSGGQSTTVNMRVTNSNTPVPQGTNLSVELQQINGAVTVTSIQAEVNNQVLDLEASNWQVTGEDGMPLIATSVEEPNSNNGQAWSNAAGTVLRNTSRVYRSDDFLTSTLIGAGSSILQGQLNGNNRRAYNYNSRTNIRVIEQNTPIKLYVIQNFGI